MNYVDVQQPRPKSYRFINTFTVLHGMKEHNLFQYKIQYFPGSGCISVAVFDMNKQKKFESLISALPLK